MHPVLKRVAIGLVGVVGPWLPTTRLRRFAAFGAMKSLMDERVLPRGVRARPLRDGTMVLCDPYRYGHRVPYWTGRLNEEELETYMRSELRPGDTVVDVGANYGHLTVLAAKLVGPQGRVYSFEPIGWLAEMVAQHCRAQGLSQVEVFPIALGAESATAVLSVPIGDEGMSTIREADAQADWIRSEVRVLRGDEVLAGRPMPGRLFLKVDVKGFEASVLTGMGELLGSRVDHAVVEFHPKVIGPAGVKEVFAKLNAGGFEARALDKQTPMTVGQIEGEPQVLFLRTRESVAAPYVVVPARSGVGTKR